jgi:hypothetical protein
MQIAISLNDSKARSSGTEPRLYHGLGMYKFLKNPGNLSPELKGSYYVVNRVLYSYMYDYATSVYEKKNMLH